MERYPKMKRKETNKQTNIDRKKGVFMKTIYFIQDSVAIITIGMV